MKTISTSGNNIRRRIREIRIGKLHYKSYTIERKERKPDLKFRNYLSSLLWKYLYTKKLRENLHNLYHEFSVNYYSHNYWKEEASCNNF